MNSWEEFYELAQDQMCLWYKKCKSFIKNGKCIYIYTHTHYYTFNICTVWHDTINFLKIFEHEVVLHKIVQPLDGEKILICY